MKNQRGNGLLEAILVGLLLMVPLVWGLGVLGELHRAALASSAAAREAGFSASRAATAPEAMAAAELAIRDAFDDHGLDPARATVRWSTTSFERGQRIEVSVSYPVSVFQAPLIGRVSGPRVWVKARHATRVQPFASRDG